MRTMICIFVISVIMILSGPLHATVLVYEGFDYPVGILTAQDGGIGFASGWVASEGSSTEGSVWDETTNVTFGQTLDWDGVVNNVPTSPASGARYAGATASGSSDIHISRTLSSSAADLAGGDGVLWLSAVYHYVNRGYGAGINIGLGNGYIRDRGRNFEAAETDYIGATGYTGTGWNAKLNASVISNKWGDSDDATTAGGTLPPTTEDLVVVLKFTFGALDTVEGYVFSENDTLSEEAFDLNKVGSTGLVDIDESTLNVLSITQGRFDNALDEIRIGDTFYDVIGAVDPSAATVDAGSDWVTWSDEPVQLADVTVVNNDPGAGPLTLQWTAIAPVGVTVGFSDDTIEEPKITVTKPLDGSVAVIQCDLTVTQPGKYPVVSAMEIDVYDDSCSAAVGSGNHVITPGDVNENCVTDIEDLLEMAQTWLVDFALTEAVDK